MGKIKDLFAKYVSRLHRTEFQGNDNLFTTVDLNREFNHIKNNTEAIEKNFELYSLEVTKTGDTFKISGNAFGFTLKDEPIVTDGTSGTLNDGCFLVFSCREYDNPIEFEEDAKKYVGAKLYGLDKVYSTSTKPSEGLYVQLSVTEDSGSYTYKVKSMHTKLLKTDTDISAILSKLSSLTADVERLKLREDMPIGSIMPLLPYDDNGGIDTSDIKENATYSKMLVENGGSWALCDGKEHIGSDGKSYATPDLYRKALTGSAYYDEEHQRYDHATPNVSNDTGSAFTTFITNFARYKATDAGGGHVVRDLVLKTQDPNNGAITTHIDTNTDSEIVPEADHTANVWSKVTGIPSTTAWYLIKVK